MPNNPMTPDEFEKLNIQPYAKQADDAYRILYTQHQAVVEAVKAVMDIVTPRRSKKHESPPFKMPDGDCVCEPCKIAGLLTAALAQENPNE